MINQFDLCPRCICLQEIPDLNFFKTDIAAKIQGFVMNVRVGFKTFTFGGGIKIPHEHERNL